MGNDIDIVRALFDAIARRDITRVAALISEETEFHAVTADVAGREGPYVGHAGLEQYFEDVEAIWDEIKLTPVDFEEVGDAILVTGRVWARGSGRVIDSSTGWIFRVAGGKLTWAQVYESAAEAVAAARD